MAENFVVNYDINVLSQDAINSINSFTTATQQIAKAAEPFRKLNTAINNLSNRMNALSKKAPTVNIRTGQAEKNVDRLIGKLRQLEAIAKRNGMSIGAVAASQGISTTGKGTTAAAAAGGAASGKKAPSPIRTGGRTTVAPKSSITSRIPNNLSYQLMGHTPLDTGGILAVDMLKGMGIAYGIAGLGTMISNAVKDYTEYNNIMQTAKNILGAHDKAANFNGRFDAMSKTIRQVGVETKFTAPEVADAAKFLAMAGFNIDSINQSIRPIADIALVGDTELGETADVVTNIMTGYGISPSNVRHAADIMTMTFTKSNTTLMEMAEAYKYSASLLSAGNVPFEEATAALGILGNAGIKGSQAGTTMRTILANIVNPTKKQLGAWEKIGVSRTDANGNIRSLSDIFADLNAKNLDVQDFYKLFHKTAAQGAVSLTKNVDEWNEIIKLNFMSDGMVKDLADAKKNTIQGLWAQLTSMFTEDGIEAFDAVQQPIRDFLTEVINWLKTDEAKNFIADFAKDLMDFAKIIADSVKHLLAFYDTFKPLIKLFVEFQLYMWPILNIARVLKAMFLGGLGVVSFTARIAGLVKQFGLLNTAIRTTGASSLFRGGFGGMMGGTMGGFGGPNYTSTNLLGTPLMVNRQTGLTRPVSPEVMARYNSIYGKYNGSMGVGLRSMGAGIIGGMAGSAVGQAVGGDTGAWIGGALGALAPMAGFMVSNPVGWITTAVVAIAGLGAAFWNASEAADKAREANQQFLSSVTMVDGVLTGEGISATEKYLNLIYNRQIDINTAMQQYIDLRMQELGINSVGDNKSSAEWSGKAFDAAKANYDNLDHWYSSEEMAKSAADKANRLSGYFSGTGPQRALVNFDGNLYWYDQDNHSRRLMNPDGTNDAQDVMAAMSALYSEGVTGQTAQRAKQEFQKRLQYAMMRGDLSDIMEIKQDWQNRFGTIRADADTYPDVFKWGMDDVASWDASRKVGTFAYQQGLFDSMNRLYGPQADIWRIANEYYAGVNSGSLNENTVAQLIGHFNEELGAWMKVYTEQGMQSWMQTIGFNPQLGTFTSGNGHTAEENAKLATENLRILVSVMTALGTPAQEAASKLWGLSNQLSGIASGFTWNLTNGGGKRTGATNGEKKVVNGITYEYNASTGKWTPIAGNGYMVMQPVDDATLNGMIGSSSSGGGNSGSTGTGGNGGHGGNGSGGGRTGTTGANQSQYKSHYNNNTAAPKQVIVKIENLMNVKSIDLSNADNAAVIESVKSQLSQALIDVVHDFDETYHG